MTRWGYNTIAWLDCCVQHIEAYQQLESENQVAYFFMGASIRMLAEHKYMHVPRLIDGDGS